VLKTNILFFVHLMKIVENRNKTVSLYCKIPCVCEAYLLKLEKTKQILCWFTQRTVDNFCKYDSDCFVLSPSVSLKTRFGKNYKNYLKELHDNNLLFRKSLGNGMHFDKNLGIATSYKLSFSCLRAIYNKQFDFVPIESNYTLPKSRTGKWCLSKNSTKNPKSLKILDSYKGISVDSDWITVFQTDSKYPANHHKYPNQPLAQYGLFINAYSCVESIQSKTISVSCEGQSGRLNHTFLQMSGFVRGYVRKNGEKLVEIDAKSFHAFLLATCIKNESEKERYLSCVGNKFYEQFTDPHNSRDSVKVSYQRFVSGKIHRDRKAQEIRKWHEDNFPDIILKMNALKSEGKTCQMFLQQLESSIFVDRAFMRSDFFCLPMHDGLAVLQEDTKKAEDLINAAFDEQLGYRIPLDTK
jgi:hypothetical protein